MTDYLTLAEVLAIHDDQIDRYGGLNGVRDFGLLESALFRPQSGYYETLIDEAAALWESLGQNHPFIDGDKRTSFAVTFTFLFINGLVVVSDPMEAFAFISGLYDGDKFEFSELSSWLREKAVPLEG